MNIVAYAKGALFAAAETGNIQACAAILIAASIGDLREEVKRLAEAMDSELERQQDERLPMPEGQ